MGNSPPFSMAVRTTIDSNSPHPSSDILNGGLVKAANGNSISDMHLENRLIARRAYTEWPVFQKTDAVYKSLC